MIEEVPLNAFSNNLQSTKLNYPQCQCGKCPRMFFNILSIASRQSGKTYNIVRLMKHYEENDLLDHAGIKHPLRVILISPTSEANPIYKSLKSLKPNDIYEEYSDDLLQNIIDDIKTKKEETDFFKEYKNAFEVLEKTDEKDISKLYEKHPEYFKILEQHNYEYPHLIPQPDYHEYPVNMVILDDLMGSSAFTTKAKSKLTNAVIKNRHLGLCFAILVQSLKSVPKNIRLNCSVFFLGKFANKKMILDDLYEEVSNILKPEEFDELYTHATDEQYGSLIVDCTGKGKKFMKGWDTELIIK